MFYCFFPPGLRSSWYSNYSCPITVVCVLSQGNCAWFVVLCGVLKLFCGIKQAVPWVAVGSAVEGSECPVTRGSPRSWALPWTAPTLAGPAWAWGSNGSFAGVSWSQSAPFAAPMFAVSVIPSLATLRFGAWLTGPGGCPAPRLPSPAYRGGGTWGQAGGHVLTACLVSDSYGRRLQDGSAVCSLFAGWNTNCQLVSLCHFFCSVSKPEPNVILSQSLDPTSQSVAISSPLIVWFSFQSKEVLIED